MKSIKESISIFFLIILTLTPFLLSSQNTDSFEFPKFVFILFLSSLIAFFLGISLKTKILLPNKEFFFFYGVFILSIIFSNNVIYSIFGDFPRLTTNLILFTSFFILQITYLNIFSNVNFHKILFYVSVLLSVFTFFEENQRVYATLGQPNFLGIILVLGIISGYKIFIELPDKKQKFLHLTGFILIFLALSKTASITSFLALGLTLIFFIKNKLVYLAIFVFMILNLFFNSLFREKTLDVFSQMTNRENIVISDSFLIRTIVWKDSLNILLENPKNFLIGVGPDNFSLFYEKYRSQEMNLTSEWGLIFDKAHNQFLEIFIEIGFLGLFFYIWILYSFFRKSNSEYKPIVFASIIFTFFNWSFIYLGLILSLLLINKNELIEIKKIKVLKSIFILLGLILFSLSIYIFYQNFFYTLSTKNLKVTPLILDLNLYEDYKSVKYQITLEDTNFFYETENTQIKIDGLNYYSQKNDLDELKFYVDYLKENYPNNLIIWFEIFKIEKNKFPEEAISTKNKINKFREDLQYWEPVFINP